MLKNSLICAWSVCLLLQFTHALPLKKREASDIAVAHKPAAVDKADSLFSEEDLIPRLQFMFTVITELTSLAKYSIEEGRALFQDTLTELNALPEKSEALQANITRLSDFVKETKDLDITPYEKKLEKIFGSMTKLAEIMADYKEMPEGDKLTETLKTAFEKSGLKKFENEFEKRLIGFAESFEKSFKSYLSVISKKDPKLISWFDKFKAEKDFEKKVEIFGEFFDIFE